MEEAVGTEDTDPSLEVDEGLPRKAPTSLQYPALLQTVTTFRRQLTPHRVFKQQGTGLDSPQGESPRCHRLPALQAQDLRQMVAADVTWTFRRIQHITPGPLDRAGGLTLGRD